MTYTGTPEITAMAAAGAAFTGHECSEIAVSTAHLAKALSISPRRVRTFVQRGHLPAPGMDGTHNLRAAVVAVLPWLDAEADDEIIAALRRREIASRTAILEFDVQGFSPRYPVRSDDERLAALLAEVDDPEERIWCEFTFRFFTAPEPRA